MSVVEVDKTRTAQLRRPRIDFHAWKFLGSTVHRLLKATEAAEVVMWKTISLHLKNTFGHVWSSIFYYTLGVLL